MKLYKSKCVCFLLIGIFLCFILGCGGGGNSVNTANSTPNINTDNAAFVAFPSGDDEARLVMPDGTTTGIEKLKEIAGKSSVNRSPIGFGVSENESDAVSSFASASADVKSSDANSRWFVGKYWCSIRWEYGYVAGCIKRNNWRLNLHIKDRYNNTEYMNAHLVVYRNDKGGISFGLYNSANKYCGVRSVNFSAIRNGIKDLIKKSTPLPSWASSSAAWTATVIVMICFGLVVWA